jgi:DNA-binding transcriptional ArsR family regulator
MSFTAEEWAWKQRCFSDKCSSCAAKLVLLCLSWYADKEGERAFPSIPTICKRTELAERTVRKALEALTDSGLIESHVRAGDNEQKRHMTTEYRLIIRELPLVDLPGVCPDAPLVNLVGEGGGRSSRGGDADLPPGASTFTRGGVANLVPELYNEPSKKKEEEKVLVPKRSKGGTLIPPDWQPTETDRDYAVSKGVDPDLAAEHHLGYWSNRADAKARKLDWSKAFQTTVRMLIGQSQFRLRDVRPQALDPSKLSGANAALLRVRQERAQLEAEEAKVRPFLVAIEGVAV